MSEEPEARLPVVALCGSMRFAAEIHRLEVELTLAGHVVLAPTELAPVLEAATIDDAARTTLGRVHLQRVAMADEVLVVGDHLGESTRREVEHARALGIPVRFVGQQA